MDPQTVNVINACTRGSDEERMSFPQIIADLKSVGVERYHADLCRNEQTYYLPCGESLGTPIAFSTTTPAAAFSAEGVVAALRAIQARQITYHAFCDRIAAAGCVGYLVSLPGRRAVYYGRTGESYVEHFPAAMP